MFKQYILLFIVLASLPIRSVNITHTTIHDDDDTIEMNIDIKLDKEELLYKDSILFSINDPRIELSSWDTHDKTSKQYIPSLHATKTVFEDTATLKLEAKNKSEDQHLKMSIHCMYLTNHMNSPQDYVIPIDFSAKITETEVSEESIEQSAQVCRVEKEAYSEAQLPSKKIRSWSERLQMLIGQSDYILLQIFLIMLLGLLMSLTPCIYPMIPITIGVMQGHGSTSFLNNLLVSISYALGMATTFATLGLIVTLSGELFGGFMNSPIVVLLIIALLLYMALSMFDLYEIYIPSFLQPKNKKLKKGSYLSAFTFGLISGTVASPCLSPGLAFVLCIVVSMGSPFLGFVMLLAFGIGLSIPLVIIGTFSNAATKLPKSGTWMIEIKKLFGILLIGMCFFYLKNILPWYIVLFCAAITLFIIGIYYYATIKPTHSQKIKRFKNIIGSLAIIASVIVGSQAFQARYIKYHLDDFWFSSYEQAHAYAQANNKLMFIDFWSTSCSVCMAINKKLLDNSNVRKALQQFVPVKIKLGHNTKNKKFQKKFKVIGLPTFLLIDDKENTLHQWGNELYNVDIEAFVNELNLLQETYTPL